MSVAAGFCAPALQTLATQTGYAVRLAHGRLQPMAASISSASPASWPSESLIC